MSLSVTEAQSMHQDLPPLVHEQVSAVHCEALRADFRRALSVRSTEKTVHLIAVLLEAHGRVVDPDESDDARERARPRLRRIAAEAVARRIVGTELTAEDKAEQAHDELLAGAVQQAKFNARFSQARYLIEPSLDALERSIKAVKPSRVALNVYRHELEKGAGQ